MGKNAEPQKECQCLHEEIEEISTLLAWSTRVSRRVTRQRGLTRLHYCFHVNAYNHLTAKGLPARRFNPLSCKEAHRRTQTMHEPVVKCLKITLIVITRNNCHPKYSFKSNGILNTFHAQMQLSVKIELPSLTFVALLIKYVR